MFNLNSLKKNYLKKNIFRLVQHNFIEVLTNNHFNISIILYINQYMKRTKVLT